MTLISRLEAAESGSRELDAEIAVAEKIDLPQPMGEAPPYLKMPAMADGCAPGTYWLVQRSGMSLRTAPHYTTSLDAARTLVPEGLQYGISTHPPDELFNPGGAQAYVTDREGLKYQHAEAMDEYLALCIAALKARQEVSE